MVGRKQHFTRLLSVVAIIIMVVSLITPSSVLAEGNGQVHTNKEKVTNRLAKKFNDDKKVTFIIKFKDKANPENASEKAVSKLRSAKASTNKVELVKRTAVLEELKDTSQASQQNVLKYLEQEADKGNAEDIQSFHIVNGLAVTATKEVADKVGEFAEVEKVLPNEKRHLHETAVNKTKAQTSELKHVEWNIGQIGAPAVWEKGFDGKGIVVASIDSGVDWDHPALKDKYRGYNEETGKVNHEFNWFDAVGGETTPYDDDGHGTHVTGTMVGSEPDGSNQIGAAPGAKWIAVKAFDKLGVATDADLLEAAQWILSPIDSKGNERPDLAPDIVNNSWGGGKGLDEWYRDVVKAWSAAGIFPEFSAGNTSFSNTGGPGSIEVPANYPESFATGATDERNELAGFSLLGPSPYGEIKPDITAPGVDIRSSAPGGGYKRFDGTSMAGPAVSGVVALLYQAAPSLSVNQLKDILRDTAIPLVDEEYPEYPNNGYGSGLVNAPAAVAAAIAEEANNLKRISGYLRYDTAIEVSRNGWASSDTVILARGDNFADALAGVPLAKKIDTPILLTPHNKLFDRTLREIKRLRAKNVVILGGPVAVNEKISTTLKKEGLNVRRIAGGTRFDTASLIASEVAPNGSDRVVVASGMDFPDALSVASHAAKEGIPILLTIGDKLPKVTQDTVNKLNAKKSIVVGGPRVVEESVIAKLPNALRLSGSDRYKTNVEIANYFGVDNDHMYVATGKTYADTLSGAVLAAKKDSAILLVHDKVPKMTSTYITKQNLKRITVFGGPVAVSNVVEDALKVLLK